jgi:hypothetical protein
VVDTLDIQYFKTSIDICIAFQLANSPTTGRSHQRRGRGSGYVNLRATNRDGVAPAG